MKLEDLPVFYQIWDDATDTWALLHSRSGDVIRTRRPLDWPYSDVPVIRHESDLSIIEIKQIEIDRGDYKVDDNGLVWKIVGSKNK